MVPREVIDEPDRIAANIVTFLYYSRSTATYFFLTLFFQQVHGYSAVRTSLMFLALGFGIAAGIAPKLTVMTSERGALAIGLATIAPDSVLFSFTTPDASIPALILPASPDAGIGLGVIAVISTGVGARGIDDSEAGIGSTLLTAGSQVGSSLGLAVLVTIATVATRHAIRMSPVNDTLTEGYSAGFLAAGIYTVCIVIALAMIKPVKQNRIGDMAVGGK